MLSSHSCLCLPDLDIQVLVKGTILRSYDTAGGV